MRDGFIIHEKTLKQMTRLSPEDTKYLMECLTTYYSTGEIDIDKVQETSIVVAVILDDAIERMDNDKESYEKSVEQRREAARKRWSKEQKDAEGMRDDATACDRIQPQCESDAGNADSVSVSVSESVIEKENSSSKSKRKKFVPPTVDEVREYCLERQNGIDAEEFIAFYDARNWMSGKTKLSNWKSCVITWEKNRNKASPAKGSDKIRQINQTIGRTGSIADQNRENMQKLINMQLAGGA